MIRAALAIALVLALPARAEPVALRQAQGERTGNATGSCRAVEARALDSAPSAVPFRSP